MIIWDLYYLLISLPGVLRDVRSVREYLAERRAVSRLFDLRELKERGVVFVYPAPMPHTDHTGRIKSAHPFDDSMAGSLLLAFFKSIDKGLKFNIVPGHVSDQTEFRKTIVCIGGPNPNGATRQIFSRLRLRYNYDKNSGKRPLTPSELYLEDTKGGNKYFYDLQTDYGLIVKCDNPLLGSDSDRGHVLIFAGIMDEGTSGAAYFFFRNYTSFAEEYGKSPFQALVKVDRNVGYLSACKVSSDYLEYL